MKAGSRNVTLIVWTMLGIPFAWLVYGWGSGKLFYGELLHQSGLVSAQLLILTMAVTPLRLMFPGARWRAILQRHRRHFGVASFAYAALHTVVYIDRKKSLALIWDEGVQLPLLTGWLAFAMFLVLALTSNDPAVRFLKRSWKKLHRLVYPAALLLFAHWLLTAFDLLSGVVHLLVLAILETARLVLQSRATRETRST